MTVLGRGLSVCLYGVFTYSLQSQIGKKMSYCPTLENGVITSIILHKTDVKITSLLQWITSTSNTLLLPTAYYKVVSLDIRTVSTVELIV